jgi:8-oxo-dGTP pyrophosphatase MutT (NUDIX family)
VSNIAHPLPAASILVVRDGVTGLEVLMTERAKTMRFAPGAFVFPGGKVDESDARLEVWGALTNGPNELPDFALRVAVLRELYEEADVLLTTGSISAETAGLPFVERILSEKTQLNVTDLVPFAHWVTPEPMPRRFDTHFYLAAHNGQTAKHDGNEAISMRWVNPNTLLSDWDADKVPLMFPTRLNLMKLARATTVSEALLQAKSTPVVRTLPVIGQDDNGVKLTIDPACGYDVLEASTKELRVESGK